MFQGQVSNLRCGMARRPNRPWSASRIRCAPPRQGAGRRGRREGDQIGPDLSPEGWPRRGRLACMRPIAQAAFAAALAHGQPVSAARSPGQDRLADEEALRLAAAFEAQLLELLELLERLDAFGGGGDAERRGEAGDRLDDRFGARIAEVAHCSAAPLQIQVKCSGSRYRSTHAGPAKARLMLHRSMA
jgi:hypothetical protein